MNMNKDEEENKLYKNKKIASRRDNKKIQNYIVLTIYSRSAHRGYFFNGYFGSSFFIFSSAYYSISSYIIIQIIEKIAPNEEKKFLKIENNKIL